MLPLYGALRADMKPYEWYPDRDRISGGDFSVDAVPAVRHGELWAIPTKDQNRWVEGEGRWVTTGAVLFGDLSTELNQAASSPRVGDRPAYKPSSS